MRLLGCFGLFVCVGMLVAAEIAVIWQLSMLWPGELFGTILVMIVLSVAGFKLFTWRKATIAPALMQGDYSVLVALFGAALIIVPGFLTGVFGALLQFTAIRKRFSGIAAKIAAAVAKQAMARGMGPKGFGGDGFAGGGFPGGSGFPGGPGGGFPGGFQPKPGSLQPDQSIGSKKKGRKPTKTIETTARSDKK